MSGKALSVSHLSKRYCSDQRRSLRYGVSDVAREIVGLGPKTALRPGEFWAVKDCSFDLSPGEAIALVGRNGAGKSTLLRLIHGLLKPDAGEIQYAGRAEAIIELGAGFDPVLSGRENILLGAALHRLDRSETARLVDKVIAFSELGAFLDAPVLSYSSGMKARLAYSISSNLQPDLLLVDEALAVGDIAFQQKCISHMKDFVRNGGALVLVSHNAQQIQAVCDRAIFLEHGEVVFDGDVGAAVSKMLKRAPMASDTPGVQRGSPIQIDSLQLSGPQGRTIMTGEAAEVRMNYTCTEVTDAVCSFSIWTDDQSVCIGSAIDQTRRRLDVGSGTMNATLTRLPLLMGNYRVCLSLLHPESLLPIARYGSPGQGAPFEIASDDDRISNLKYWGRQLIKLDVEWH